MSHRIEDTKTVQLLLLRHGETTWNEEKRLQGSLFPGPSCNEKGIAQAQEAASILQRERLDAIVSSDLLRAEETALVVRAACDDDVPYEKRSDLRERCLGRLSGMKISEAKKRHPEEWNAMRSDGNIGHRATGIESKEDFQNRGIAALEDVAISHAGIYSKILVVSHGGIISAAYRKAVGNNPRRPCVNGSISSFHLDISLRPISWTLDFWNRSPNTLLPLK